jgi:hypothetical protein
VARQVEGGGPERFLRMTLLAAVFVGRGAEFAAVRVGVAIHADQLARLIRSFFAGRLMTQLAFHFEMFAFQLERALLMRIAREQRWLELCLGMAGVTIGARRSSRKLAAMNVLMAIAAQRMGHRSAEIIVLVALRTGALGMFSMQRKPGFVVIEAACG